MSVQLAFRLNWVPQGPNSPFLHAADAGWFAEIGLDLVFSEAKSSAAAVTDVAEGTADLAFGDVPAVLARALVSDRTDVYAVMPVYRRSPSALAYLDTGAPLALADLAGAAIAGPPGDTTARLLPLLLARNGLADLACRYATVDAETRDHGLAAGRWRAVTCFDATVRFAFAARGLPTERLRFLYLADHGLDLLSAGLVAAPAIAADAELVAALRRVVRRAWEACRAEPDLGVAAVARRLPDADPAITRAHLDWVLERQVFVAGTDDPFAGFPPDAVDATLAAIGATRAVDVVRAKAALLA
jgi:ABC-type nitrate/sulfonate/bicarbonate transport system substrate-binding protein